MTTSPNPLEPYRAAGWRGCVRSDWAEQFAGRDPLRWLCERPREAVRERVAAQTWRTEIDGRCLYVKRTTALKDQDRPAERWWNHWRWVLGPARSLSAARLCRKLNDAGLATPPIVLAVRHRRGAQAQELLVTEEVRGLPLHLAVRQPEDVGLQRAVLLEMVGRSMATLHRRGFTHGDLNPSNVLVSADGSGGMHLVYLDNERTRVWWPRSPRSLRRRNLGQMLYRLLPSMGYRQMRHLLDSYWRTLGVGGAHRRREQCVVLRWVRRRFQQRVRPFPRHWRLAKAPIGAG